MKTHFGDYKFRCHAVGKLMTGIKTNNLTERQEKMFFDFQEKMKVGKITDKQIVAYGQLLEKKNAKPKLSQTAISYLNELHKEVLFNRRKEIQSKYLDKGIQVEEKSITLYSEVTGKLFIKNKDRFENDFLSGEPDMTEGKVRDIKSSWSFDTFPLYDTEIKNKIYYWQLQSYMALTGLTQAELIYCLVDTPSELIEDEKWRIARATGFVELPEELVNEIEHNLTYNDIPQEFRVKIFKVDKNQKDIEALYKVIDLAREYLTNLSIEISNKLELVA